MNQRSSLAKISKNAANVRLRANKKRSKADIKREWGIPSTYPLRYNSPPLKGIAWYWFARYIRKRDALKWGKCISCGKPKTFDELQAGHFMPAGSCGLSLLFDEANVNGECEGCNGFDSTHLLKYARNLDLRYGKNTAEILEERYKLRHQVNVKLDWLELASHYKIEFELL